eukprot:CAMPEP_0197699104 /NCGR_PEP_ID=MMETSP1338-20131121/120177_1 /TAXON_ID=43686 ORGANISM="Pelagodinium beii, Strain RCC1491" /NCGR_SAMPLE_ID=MMETSP1338 /ASSEMBLY_ACC=CAM_ASM_000754 /LENGTH=69 /DNA_ID=CAMNT_0043282563 /DNA_START=535 /DNA_END=740 /DNA_ORIENTATION=-
MAMCGACFPAGEPGGKKTLSSPLESQTAALCAVSVLVKEPAQRRSHTVESGRNLVTAHQPHHVQSEHGG